MHNNDTYPIRRAIIQTSESWAPEMGWSPAPDKVDESFNSVISAIVGEGVSWIRCHIEGQEKWFNLDNVISITCEKLVGDD